MIILMGPLREEKTEDHTVLERKTEDWIIEEI